MTFPVSTFNRVWVRGRMVDLDKMALGESQYGAERDVIFTPNVSPPVLLSMSTGHIIAARPFSASPSPVDGYFAIQVPCTDDPDINPIDWTYTVQEPSGRVYPIEVSITTPILDNPDDPLHGERVIDLVSIAPASAPSGGTVQLVAGAPGPPGVSVTDADVDGAGHLLLSMSDFTTVDAGYVVGPEGPEGPQGDPGPQGEKGDPGDGSVNTVNGDPGPEIVLSAADVGAAPEVHTHGYSPLGHAHDYAEPTHTHDYAATSHTHSYAPIGHSHAIADVSGLQAALDAKASKALTTNTQTGSSYTLAASDGGGVVEMNNGSANAVTVPPNSSVPLPIGYITEVCQIGAGATTIAAGVGVTIRTPASLGLRARYSTVGLRKRGTDEWVASGDLT